jgi:hypothetical protein
MVDRCIVDIADCSTEPCTGGLSSDGTTLTLTLRADTSIYELTFPSGTLTSLGGVPAGVTVVQSGIQATVVTGTLTDTVMVRLAMNQPSTFSINDSNVFVGAINVGVAPVQVIQTCANISALTLSAVGSYVAGQTVAQGTTATGVVQISTSNSTVVNVQVISGSFFDNRVTTINSVPVTVESAATLTTQCCDAIAQSVVGLKITSGFAPHGAAGTVVTFAVATSIDSEPLVASGYTITDDSVRNFVVNPSTAVWQGDVSPLTLQFDTSPTGPLSQGSTITVRTDSPIFSTGATVALHGGWYGKCDATATPFDNMHAITITIGGRGSGTSRCRTHPEATVVLSITNLQQHDEIPGHMVVFTSVVTSEDTLPLLNPSSCKQVATATACTSITSPHSSTALL